MHSFMQSFNIITYHSTVRFNYLYKVNSQNILVQCDIMKRPQIFLTQSHNSITCLYGIMKILYLFSSIYKVLKQTLSPSTHFYIQLFFWKQKVVWYSHIFENNLAIKFTKYLKESWCMTCDHHFSIKCFPEKCLYAKYFQHCQCSALAALSVNGLSYWIWYSSSILEKSNWKHLNTISCT